MTLLTPVDVPIDNIFLDANNYRFQDLGDYSPVPRDKIKNDVVQRRTIERLKSFGFEELKNSIIENGFVVVDRVVLSKIDDDNYIVIEGNRRIAALKSIQSDIANKLLENEGLSKTISSIPCVVTDAESNEVFQLTLMGIRHVGGVHDWGGYQRAKLVCDMRDKLNLNSQEVASKIGLSVQEVNRRYRAFKALEQMRENEEYEDYAKPSLYPIFHEAVSQPIVREWLGWNAEKVRFETDIEVEFFYELITPNEDDHGVKSEAKVNTYSHVRSLKQVLLSEEAKMALYDDDQPFVNAVLLAKRKELSGKWRKEVKEATSSLKSIGALDLADFTDADIKLLGDIKEAAAQLMTQFEKITA